MKISSLTPDNSMHMQSTNIEADNVLLPIFNFMTVLKSTLNRMGSAIAIGEAGDLEAANELRRKYDAS